MKKTLYVHIDSSPLPEEKEDLIILECSPIDDFCSFMAYELIDGLYTTSGIPFYKVFQPGNLFADFANSNKEVFALIVYRWEGIQSELLHKKSAKEVVHKFKLPDEYTNWLLHHDDEHYKAVGNKLRQKYSEIALQGEDLYQEVIMGLRQSLKKYLHDNEALIDCIVFSDSAIRYSSTFVKDLNVAFSDVDILCLKQWKRLICHKKETNKKEHIQNLDMEFVVNGIEFMMVYVKGGEFSMGTDYNESVNSWFRSRPIHLVKLTDYYIGRYPVTQELWKAVMDINPSYFRGRELPVEKVSWEDCQEFVGKLSKITGKHFVLPTEAQWEYAARGGVKSEGFEHAGSNDISSVAWYQHNSSKKTHEVGIKMSNELNLYDMSGNVEEWCNDWYDTYSPEVQINPQGPSYGSYRVYRGGNCEYCRNYSVAYRGYSVPTKSYRFLGMRLVLLP